MITFIVCAVLGLLGIIPHDRFDDCCVLMCTELLLDFPLLIMGFWLVNKFIYDKMDEADEGEEHIELEDEEFDKFFADAEKEEPKKLTPPPVYVNTTGLFTFDDVQSEKKYTVDDNPYPRERAVMWASWNAQHGIKPEDETA